MASARRIAKSTTPEKIETLYPTHDIDPYGEFLVEVRHPSQHRTTPEGVPDGPLTTVFRVTKRVLSDVSPWFRQQLRSKVNFVASENKLVVTEARIFAVEVIFRLWHGDPLANSLLYLRTISPSEIVQIVKLAKKWGVLFIKALSPSTMKEWFNAWYEMRIGNKPLAIEDYEKLLYPCWAFDHPKGFLRASRALAYNSVSFIKLATIEANDELPVLRKILARILRELNNVRCQLPMELDNLLEQPLERLFIPFTKDADCRCLRDIAYAYQKELRDLKVFPISKTSKAASPQELLVRVKQCKVRLPDISCKHDFPTAYTEKVQAAGKHIEDYFEGLCLDCLDPDNHKFGADGVDYWRDNMMRRFGKWNYKCRIDHGEQSWYYSFLGRNDVEVLDPEI